MRDATGILCDILFVFVVLCELVGTWHGQADNRTLESSEESCALSEDARTLGSIIQSSTTDESLIDIFTESW